MSVIVIFGGTGYTGRNVAREAADRGHTVIAVSRSTPSDPIPGVRYETGDVSEVAPRVIPSADAVVATLSPRGDMAGRLVDIYRNLAAQAAAAGPLPPGRRLLLAASRARGTAVRRGRRARAVPGGGPRG
jgi:nucleoside-diphosphate-sugar epimerase